MTDNIEKLKIEIEPSSPYAITSGETHMYVQLKLIAPEIKPAEDRVNFNLGVVLDRSGSMGGPKIQKAKKAVEFVVENLLSTDVFSLVIYDDVIETIIPAGNVSNRSAILQRLEKVTARNMTNLHGGMVEGSNQIATKKNLEYKNIMFLLSDGLANVGISDKIHVAIEAKNINEKNGITISSFGIGDDFDEDMMVGISDAASGEFYYIKSADDIPKFIENEFQGLLQTVASSISVKNLTFAKGIKLNRILGVPLEDQEKTKHNLGDLRSGGDRVIIFDLTLPSGKSDSKEKILTIDLSYTSTDLELKSEEIFSEITYTENEELLATENQKVLDYVALLETAHVREEALLLADRGDFEGARTILSTQQMKLKGRAAMPGSMEQINDVMTQNEDFMGSTLEEKEYSKASRKAMKSASYNLRKQRK